MYLVPRRPAHNTGEDHHGTCQNESNVNHIPSFVRNVSGRLD